MKMISKRIHSGNLQLFVNLHGNPANPPVMLVHGYPDDSHVWHKLVAHLVNDYYVITYDVRGCGRSDTPRDKAHYGLRYLMADIFNIIRAVSPDRPVHLIGHDWGSIQSWEAATEPGADKHLASFTTISGPCLDHVGLGIRDQFFQSPASSLNQTLHSWYIGFFHLPFLAPNAWKLGLAKAWPALVNKLENAPADPSPYQERDGVNGINLYRANILPRLLRPRRRYAQVPVHAIVSTKDTYVTEPLLRNMPDWAPDFTRSTLDTTHWGPLLKKDTEAANLICHFYESRQAGSPAAKAV